MNSYVNGLIESKTVCDINDYRTIITDRMGPWSNQNVTLVWEGYRHGTREIISLTPDEVEILYHHKLITNVELGEDEKLHMGYTYDDIRTFSGAIVCGILAPTTRQSMRKEIVDYAIKMGYITDKMTPVEMSSGTKQLIVNEDSTYNIIFSWHKSIMENISKDFLREFTMNYFGSAYNVDINNNNNSVYISNLSESTAFSRAFIDLLRVYDIQLLYLNQEIDKVLLLKALMHVVFSTSVPYNLLRKGLFRREPGNIEIPKNRINNLEFDKFGKVKMNCGTLYSADSSITYSKDYTYEIDVPYSEFLRDLMVDFEKVLNYNYQHSNTHVSVMFNPYAESFNIHIAAADSPLESSLKNDFIIIDYAISLRKDSRNYNVNQFYRAILSLLELDSSGEFQYSYFEYLQVLKDALPEKAKLM